MSRDEKFFRVAVFFIILSQWMTNVYMVVRFRALERRIEEKSR